jgi:hypothetical protein
MEGHAMNVQRGGARLAAVRFGPVQSNILLNLGPDRRSGSANSLNLGPDPPEPVERVRRVRFKVQRHLNREPDLYYYNFSNLQYKM